MSSDTALAHAGCVVDPTTGALTPLIRLSSTFERDKDLSYPKGYLYGRVDNPTRRLVETTRRRRSTPGRLLRPSRLGRRRRRQRC